MLLDWTSESKVHHCCHSRNWDRNFFEATSFHIFNLEWYQPWNIYPIEYFCKVAFWTKIGQKWTKNTWNTTCCPKTGGGQKCISFLKKIAFYNQIPWILAYKICHKIEKRFCLYMKQRVATKRERELLNWSEANWIDNELDPTELKPSFFPTCYQIPRSQVLWTIVRFDDIEKCR